MADLKISALTASTTPLAGTEVLPIVQSGSTVKVSVANLTASRAVSMSSLAVGTASPTAGYLADIRGRGRNVSTSDYIWDFISPSSNASIVQVYADNSVGALVIGGTTVPDFSFFVSGEKLTIEATGGAVRPGADNAQSLGTASRRWSVVYAATALINTSDARTKQQVLDLSEAERAVAKRIKGLIKTFKFNDAVEAKGDGARIHVGVMAQEVAAAFEAEGLDPTKYAMFCHDKWEDKFVEHSAIEAVEEVRDENGNVIQPAIAKKDAWVEQVEFAGDRFGIRYEELLAFVISAI